MTGVGNDRDLVKKAISGDALALNELLVVHFARLKEHVASKIPSNVQGVVSPEDIVQQTFVKAMSHITSFQPRAGHSFYGWLKTIAENSAQDTIRRLTSEKRGGGRLQVRQALNTLDSRIDDLIALLSAGSNTPSRSAARHEAIADVQKAIDELPHDNRQAIQLRLLEGKSLAEVAKTMGRSQRAVQGLVDRGKKKMRAKLGRLSLYE